MRGTFLRQERDGSNITAAGAGAARPQARGAPARGSGAAEALGAAARWRCCPAVGRRGRCGAALCPMPAVPGRRAVPGGGGFSSRLFVISLLSYLFVRPRVLPSSFVFPARGLLGPHRSRPRRPLWPPHRGAERGGAGGAGRAAIGGGSAARPAPWQCLCPRAHAGVIPLGWRGRAAWPGSPSARSSRSSSASAGPSPALACTPPTKVRRGRPAGKFGAGAGPSAPRAARSRALPRAGAGQVRGAERECRGPRAFRPSHPSHPSHPGRGRRRRRLARLSPERRRAGARGADAARDGAGAGAGARPPLGAGVPAALRRASEAPLVHRPELRSLPLPPRAARAAPASGPAPRRVTSLGAPLRAPRGAARDSRAERSPLRGVPECGRSVTRCFASPQ